MAGASAISLPAGNEMTPTRQVQQPPGQRVMTIDRGDNLWVAGDGYVIAIMGTKADQHYLMTYDARPGGCWRAFRSIQSIQPTANSRLLGAPMVAIRSLRH